MDKSYSYPIVINDLNWNFNGTKILSNLNLKIEKNKFYSIIGPNGSGKTTLLKNIAKLLPPKKSCIWVNGLDISSIKSNDLAKQMSCVPQNTIIDFEFTVMDIVLMGRSPYLKKLQTENEKDFEMAMKAMKITNTWELREKCITELSGGERQRVIIARALTQNTDIILLDEPISNLDLHHQIEVLDTIKFFNKNITVLAVLHDLNLAAQYSDYLVLLNNGHIEAEGTPEAVLTKGTLNRVYKTDVTMIKDPITGKPHIIPISKYLKRNLK